MRNAYVTADHHGDDGTVREGQILYDVSYQRFDALHKAGLAREATADEAKAGYRPEIASDESKVAAEKEAPKPLNKQAPKPAAKGA